MVLLIAVVGGGAYYYTQTTSAANDKIISGTIEAREVQLGAVTGGRVTEVHADEGDTVIDGDVLIEVSASAGGRGVGKEMVHTPINGVVLDRSVEPGEVAATGAPLMTVGDLTDLSVTVYVPEDRYGLISLGQRYPVTVDSYPNDTFMGTVTHIADKAEFTPRNVQTTDSRKTTVFAIKLAMDPADGKLKPGMPADVHFDQLGG